ncbi:MAG: hypothetical protein ABW067_07680 [Rhizobacter sp.]
MSNANWLSEIDGAKTLNEITLPGSHDAGVYSDTTVAGSERDVKVVTPFVSPGQVRCQSLSILNQAVAGSRFFDCRVYLRSFPLKKVVDGKMTTEQKVPTLGHFFKDTKEGMGGGYGGSLLTVINDAIGFVRSHPTEFIILRFSHTKCTDEVADMLEMVYDTRDNCNFIFAGDVNIAQARVSDLRGKVVMVFDGKFNKQRLPSYQVKKNFQFMRAVEHKAGRGLASKGMHLFSKFDEGKASGNGLCTCGGFASSDKMDKVYDKSIAAVKKHLEHGNDHLCFVYWQLTGGNVQNNTMSPTTGTHARLDGFINDVVRSAMASGNLPNVISHDFVSEDSCAQIIALNKDRKALMAQAIAADINAKKAK